MATLYKYVTQGGREVTFEDEKDEYKPDDIRKHWAQTFPELANASVSEAEEEGTKVVTFAKRVGTKGYGEAHRWRVSGDLMVGETVFFGTVDMKLEAPGKQAALDNALSIYCFNRGTDPDYVDWDNEFPPEVEDLGEVPQDVLMRRQGQPELSLAKVEISYD